MQYRNDFIVSTNDDALHDTMNGTVTGKLIRCQDCIYRSGTWCERFSRRPMDEYSVHISLEDFCSAARTGKNVE